MIFSHFFNSRFSLTLITLAAFILSSCSPVEETFNSTISEITDESVQSDINNTATTPDDTVGSGIPGDSVITINPILPINPIVSIDPVTPADPIRPSDPIVIIDPVIPADPVVIVVPVTPVTPVTPSTVELSWIAPSTRENAVPLSLSEIAGYKIYFGTRQGTYNNTIDVNDSTAVSYVLSGLTTGIYYIVLTTFDTDGRESQYSVEVEVSV